MQIQRFYGVKPAQKFQPFAQISCHEFRWFNRMDRLLGFRCQAFHKPAELLGSQSFYFSFVPRPDKPALFQAFVQEKESILFPYKSFEAIRFASAEKIQGIRDIWIVSRFLINYGSQCIYTGSQVGVATNDIHLFETGSVI